MNLFLDCELSRLAVGLWWTGFWTMNSLLTVLINKKA